jgi:hypothetical protein
MVTQNTDNKIPLSRLTIPIAPPFLKEQKPTLNEFGLPIKNYYMTGDICPVLKVRPHTFRNRFKQGYYPEPKRINGKRIFTLQEAVQIMEISKNLFMNDK